MHVTKGDYPAPYGRRVRRGPAVWGFGHMIKARDALEQALDLEREACPDGPAAQLLAAAVGLVAQAERVRKLRYTESSASRWKSSSSSADLMASTTVQGDEVTGNGK